MKKQDMKKVMYNKIIALDKLRAEALDDVNEMYQIITGDTDYNMSLDHKVIAVKKLYQAQGHDLAETTLDIEHLNNSRKRISDRYFELLAMFQMLFDETIEDYQRKQEAKATNNA